jgi:hypothetical protein
MNSDERDPLRAALEPGPDCPPLARLIDAAFAAAPTAEQRALLTHASACASCAAELELAGAFTAPARSPEEAAEIAWVESRIDLAAARGVTAEPAPLARVLPMRRKKERASTAQPAWTKLAAAALLVVGIAVTLRWSVPSGPPILPDVPATDVVRGGALTLESPLGELAEAPARFDWQSVPGAARYTLEIRDVAGDPVASADAAESALEIPPGLAAKLESHVAYSWSVVARDAAGVELARSAPAIFRYGAR